MWLLGGGFGGPLAIGLAGLSELVLGGGVGGRFSSGIVTESNSFILACVSVTSASA